jgi:hypothetical protein
VPVARADLPPHLKFGYAIVMEKASIRDRLQAAGIADLITLYFAVEREYEKAHAHDISYRKKCERRAASAQHTVTAVTVFTADELRLLIEHFANANDPVAIAVGIKAQQALAAMTVTSDVAL